MAKAAAELLRPIRELKKRASATRCDGCWIHCYPDPDGNGVYFIVRESFDSGALAVSSNVTANELETERVLVALGADPAEAHARVQEAIAQGTAFLFFR